MCELKEKARLKLDKGKTCELFEGEKVLINKVLGIFFTNTCPVCGQTVAYNQKGACVECKTKIKYVREPQCKKCGRPIMDEYKMICPMCEKGNHSFDKGMCVFEHTGEIKKSIYDFKYQNRREYSEFYAKEAVRIYGREIKKLNIHAIIPVPIHKEREIERGYNQALEFAQVLGRYTGIPVAKRVLIRKKKTSPQKELSETGRYINLKNAFAVEQSNLKGIRNALIVDDIYTTGSTIDACSSILKRAGVEKVYFLCISAGAGKSGNCSVTKTV